MFATVICVLCVISCVLSASLRTQNDGFILQNIDGERHLSYGVVPENRGESLRLEFYDASFSSQNCDDLKVMVYGNGYIRTSQNLLDTICDQAALNDFTHESFWGFFIQVSSSKNITTGQIKARFSGDYKVTQEVFFR